jgi:hypothetical protein
MPGIDPHTPTGRQLPGLSDYARPLGSSPLGKGRNDRGIASLNFPSDRAAGVARDRAAGVGVCAGQCGSLKQSLLDGTSKIVFHEWFILLHEWGILLHLQHLAARGWRKMTLGTYGRLFDYGGDALAASLERRRDAHRNGGQATP